MICAALLLQYRQTNATAAVRWNAAVIYPLFHDLQLPGLVTI